MKVRINDDGVEFQPVVVGITLETEAEATALTALFGGLSLSKVCEIMREGDDPKLAHELSYHIYSKLDDAVGRK